MLDKNRRLFLDFSTELIGLKIRIGAEIVGALGMRLLYEAVHLLIARETVIRDRAGETLKGTLFIKTLLTVKRGDVFFRDIEFKGEFLRLRLAKCSFMMIFDISKKLIK